MFSNAFHIQPSPFKVCLIHSWKSSVNPSRSSETVYTVWRPLIVVALLFDNMSNLCYLLLWNCTPLSQNGLDRKMHADKCITPLAERKPVDVRHLFRATQTTLDDECKCSGRRESLTYLGKHFDSSMASESFETGYNVLKMETK